MIINSVYLSCFISLASDLKILYDVEQEDLEEMSKIRNQTESYQNELNADLTHKLNKQINNIISKYIS